MDNDFATQETRTAEAKTEKPFGKAWFAILGFISLSSSIGLIQSIAKYSAGDPDKIILIANWLPWIAGIFLALGWFTIHWFEIALLKKRFRSAILLLAILVVGSILISSYFQFFTDNEVLHDFATVSLTLLVSGYFLRFSMFRNESVLPLQNLISRKTS